MEREVFLSLYETSKLLNKSDDITKWHQSCDRAIEKLNKVIADKSVKLHVNTRNSLINRRVLLERCKKKLRRRVIHSGEGVASAKKNDEDLYWLDMETAFESRVITGAVVNLTHIDPRQFLNSAKDIVFQRVQDALNRFNSIKINTCFHGEFIVKEKTDIKAFHTKNCELFQTLSDLEEWYEEQVIKNILTQMEEFQERDSGWALSSILNLQLNINKYDPIRGGCYVDLPLDIKRKQAIINIITKDKTCFVCAVVAALYPAKKDAQRPTKYPDFKKVLNLKDITFPITMKQIKKFEKIITYR